MKKTEKSVTRYLAHSKNSAGVEDPVLCHLRKVADRAAAFADHFRASEEAELAGLLHDLGKYGDLFQARLAGKERGIDHWSLGAWQALMKYKNHGLASALAIQGHHIGIQKAEKEALAQLNPVKAAQHHPLGLRLSDPDGARLIRRFEGDGLTLPDRINASVYSGLQAPPAAAMADVRMLYSTLVDADFIETEAHFNDAYRESGLPLMPDESLDILMAHIETLSQKSKAAERVNQMRSDLLDACLETAQMPQGVYTLTAPTGSGKTLNMLAFALKHAALHGLRRIIMVIPYLSIIDQTVREYKRVFQKKYGSENIEKFILEHHSLTGIRSTGDDTSKPIDADDESIASIRLLAENWDAPIIVTTSVQFFESLFSNRPSACRKLHNLVGSVILFDEIQTFPISLAIPTLATLSRLAEKYRSTIVLATATQPAFSALDEPIKQYSSTGWSPVPIAPPQLKLFERARRTEVEWPNDPDFTTPWYDLGEMIRSHNQVLCVVNLKRHAFRLLDELVNSGTEGVFHLSTNMCPAHRQSVLDEVRQRLDNKQPCRLVSTQCIEAGVDVDFPFVLRALAPLDAIAQAAGRCNRNGRTIIEKVKVFVPDDEDYPDATYRQAAAVTRSLLKELGPSGMDIHNPLLYDTYYQKLYDISNPELQKMEIQEAIQRQDFVDVANKYRIIANDAVNVFVPYGPINFEEMIAEVHITGLTRHWINRVRPYAISIFRPKKEAPIWQYVERAPV
ncbi:MAG: CRISPR-associated helicase Cas3', partial [Proteobacteria bacterium]|nr:CRISPR-associated helicase Cas3' [Pseudomonadota bacterium]